MNESKEISMKSVMESPVPARDETEEPLPITLMPCKMDVGEVAAAELLPPSREDGFFARQRHKQIRSDAREEALQLICKGQLEAIKQRMAQSLAREEIYLHADLLTFAARAETVVGAALGSFATQRFKTQVRHALEIHRIQDEAIGQIIAREDLPNAEKERRISPIREKAKAFSDQILSDEFAKKCAALAVRTKT